MAFPPFWMTVFKLASPQRAVKTVGGLHLTSWLTDPLGEVRRTSKSKPAPGQGSQGGYVEPHTLEAPSLQRNRSRSDATPSGETEGIMQTISASKGRANSKAGSGMKILMGVCVSKAS